MTFSFDSWWVILKILETTTSAVSAQWRKSRKTACSDNSGTPYIMCEIFNSNIKYANQTQVARHITIHGWLFGINSPYLSYLFDIANKLEPNYQLFFDFHFFARGSLLEEAAWEHSVASWGTGDASLQLEKPAGDVPPKIVIFHFFLACIKTFSKIFKIKGQVPPS